MIVYQNSIPEKNIGKQTGKEFAVYYKEGVGMFFLYKDGTETQCNDNDDREILNELAVRGEVTMMLKPTYLNNGKWVDECRSGKTQLS